MECDHINVQWGLGIEFDSSFKCTSALLKNIYNLMYILLIILYLESGLFKEIIYCIGLQSHLEVSGVNCELSL